jgi:hypothetical protein
VSKTQYISSFITKALALAFYISFLGVQLFFNFDTGKGPAITIHICNYASQHNSFPPGIKQNNKPKCNATVLLNKRFQPESILVVNTISIKAPAYYIETAIKYSPFDQYIPDSISCVHSKRGPPAVA